MKSFSHIQNPPSSTRDVPSPLVLHVRVVAGAGGGPDKTIFRSAAYTDSSRYRIAAAYIHPHGDPGMDVIREQAKTQNCPLWEIAEAGATDPRTVRSLVQLCRKLRVTIWHGHDYKSNLLGLVVRRFWPMKLVTTVHGWTRETARTRLYYHVDNWCLPRYNEVIAVSPQLFYHARARGVPAARLTYLSNTIDPEDFRRRCDSATVRREIGIDPDALVIGVVGRLSVEKGIDRSVLTLAELLPRYPATQLHIIGDGPELANVKALAGKLNVAEAVRFHGWQSESKRFYEMMDVLLLPSHTEGSPNVVLEAMAMGVPVAATDVGSVRELLKGGKCGVILNQNQLTWAGQIAPLLVSRERREEFARLGRRRIERHYSFVHRVTAEMAIYDRLLKVQPVPMRRAA